MSHKKILILTSVFLRDIGGPPIQLKALILELAKHGFDTRVLTFGKQDKEYPYQIITISERWPTAIKSFLFLVKALYYALRSDILYNQDLYSAGIASLIVKKITRKPLVTRFVGDSAWEKSFSKGLVHDDIMTFQKNPYSFQVGVYKRLRTMILTNSDRVVVVSNFLRDVAIAIGVRAGNLKVIYNSIDFLDLKPSLPDKESLKKKMGLQGWVLLTNARLTAWKGVGMLIKLMPDLIEKYKTINLVIIGEGPDRAKLEAKISELKVGGHVKMLGQVSRQKVVDCLVMADMFLLNTYYEGMSHVLLEAMKMGTPIITTPAGGNIETITHGQTGFLVEFNNKQQWFEAVSSLIDNELMRKQFARAAKKDIQRFDWTRLVSKTVKIFNSL